MTNGEYAVREIIQKNREIERISEEVKNLEEDLHGMEIRYEGNYAVIEFVNGLQQEVHLYVEEEDGNSYSVLLHISELLEIITK